MSLTKIVEETKTASTKGEKQTIYSPKLDKYVPLESGNAKGDMQKYNIGINPGSWY